MVIFKDSFLRDCKSANCDYEGDTVGEAEAAAHLSVSIAEVLKTECVPGESLINYEISIAEPFSHSDEAALWEGASRGAYQWCEDAFDFIPTAIRYRNGWVLSAIGYREGTRRPLALRR